jgi:hypothetical protein
LQCKSLLMAVIFWNNSAVSGGVMSGRREHASLMTIRYTTEEHTNRL